MKLLLDENLSYRIVDHLAIEYPGTTQVRLVKLEQVSDREVWQYAKTHEYIIVTQDSDFHELSLIEGPPPKVIWLKCGNQTKHFIVKLLLQHKTEIEQFFQANDVVCLEIY